MTSQAVTNLLQTGQGRATLVMIVAAIAAGSFVAYKRTKRRANGGDEEQPHPSREQKRS